MGIPQYEKDMTPTRGDSDTYYQEIYRQAAHIAEFDLLVDSLKSESLSKREAFAIFNDMLGLFILNGNSGIFRPRDPALADFESPLHRKLIFILSSIQGVGFTSAAYLGQFIGSLHLKGRADMGAVPAAMNLNIEQIVGHNAVEEPEEFASVRKSFEQTANSIG
jgi:hypothetical protein